ncbi:MULTISPECIES: helix-turn-helix transcriptional regulator [Actinomadura]|uniref:Helix-turn-helix domain-containing protein n=1 Tax=Actinomadura litoris TaxID=2678616 RepID=A0A7K1L0M0_9ACTN|nr:MULTISPECIES: helix-turn-helix transcriptional regulator [Actinomadura]MBT2206917.1 helix-turn-helix domain-containing protein [Actinomadura sp. NEAU-AAG7]MUN37981.1 helix-turn-helix domain-containing protein [Actinomadura litoris]
MAERRSPPVRARQLARELRRLREIEGLTGEEVAGSLGWSSAKVSRVETAATLVRPGDLGKLIDLYHVTGSHRERLLAMARGAEERGWWDAFPDVGSDYADYIGLEAETQALRCYSAQSLNGLLQTEEYARALIGMVVDPAPGRVERRVDVRLRRQRRLREEPPVDLHVVLDEAAIRRRVGGPAVMKAQLEHLSALAEMPNVVIQVLPFDAGAHAAMAGSFITLKFPHPQTDMVFVELLRGSVYVEDEMEVYRYHLAFEQLRERAIPPDESSAFIRRAADEM